MMLEAVKMNLALWSEMSLTVFTVNVNILLLNMMPQQTSQIQEAAIFIAIHNRKLLEKINK